MKKFQINKKTVLFIYPYRLLPVSGGGASRTLEIIAYLRKSGFRLELLTRDQGKEKNETLAARVDKLWLFTPPPPPPPPNAPSLRRFLIRKASQSENIQQFLKLPEYDECIPTLKVDENGGLSSKRVLPFEIYTGEVVCKIRPAAIAAFAWGARVLDFMPPETLRILDIHDVQHIRAERAKAFGGDLSDRFCTREEEINEIRRADVLMAIESEEQQTLLKQMCPEKQVILVEHSLEGEKLQSHETSTNLLFVGNLYDPNVRGVKQFLEHAWPRIRSEFPQSKFFICGRISEALPKDEKGVFYDGLVPNLIPYYQSVSIVINSVLYGTGLNIKTVEALAYGKCLVTTEAGVKGFSDMPNPPFVIAAVEQMADKIIDLLKHPNRRHQIEERAWQFARKRFKPSNAFRELTNVLQDHIDKIKGM